MSKMHDLSAGPADRQAPADAWQARRNGNLKLAWGLVGVVLAVFVIALFRFRPL